MAMKNEVNAIVVECFASADEIANRLLRRVEGNEHTASDGRLELYKKQKESWEPMSDITDESYACLDTTGPTQETVAKLLYDMFSKELGNS